MDMTTNENTSQTETHEDHCRTNDERKPGSLDWGCTCTWTDEDEQWLRRNTD
jgi:hypothetical protein